jgi:NADPH-dependent ferric siderophore reductase
MAAEPPYLVFAVRVQTLTRLTPNFLRITFTGDTLDRFADNGVDQRIKVLLPGPDGQPYDPTPPAGSAPGADWYENWRALPDERRNPMRTYTVRYVRTGQREVDVDFVLHGDIGPASRWAGAATVGDVVHLIGPNVRHEGSTRAAGWNPPPTNPFVLIAGDQTAVPAIAVILAQLPSDAEGTVLLEVPDAADEQLLEAPAGVKITWTVGDPAAPGARLEAAVRQEAGSVLGSSVASDPAPAALDPETSVEDLWDVPEPDQVAPKATVYAWLAGEAGCIARLRRHLVRDLGVDRRAVAFMGYWRAGAAESD